MLLLAITDIQEALFEIIIMLSVTAILAGLIVYLLCRRQYKKLEAKHNALLENHSALEEEHKRLQLEYRRMEENANRLNAQNKDLQASLTDCHSRREYLENELATLRPFKTRYEDLLPLHQQKLAQMGELELQLAESKANENSLNGALMDAAKRNKKLDEEILLLNVFKSRSENLKEENEGLKEKLENLTLHAENIEGNNKGLAEKVAELNASLQDCLERNMGMESQTQEIQSQKEREEAEVLERIKQKAAGIIDFDRIGAANAEIKDDLKRVKGIGPFIEKKLNSIGIFTFAQIAKLTEDDEEKINDLIEVFPGRMKRDRWVRQSVDFEKQKEEEQKKKEDEKED